MSVSIKKKIRGYESVCCWKNANSKIIQRSAGDCNHLQRMNWNYSSERNDKHTVVFNDKHDLYPVFFIKLSGPDSGVGKTE